MISCRKCGHENPDGTRFCEVCGSYIGWDQERSAATAAPSRTVESSPADEPGEATAPAEEDGAEDPAAAGRWKVKIIELGRSSRAKPDPMAVTPQAAEPQRSPAAKPAPVPPDDVEAVKPDEQQAPPPVRTRHTPAPQPARAPKPGEIRCGNCGRYNPPGTRFCRCGNALPVQPKPAAQATTPAPPALLPWYRRLLGGADRDRVRQATRAARITYDRGLGLRARWVRATLLLGALGIGVTAVAPWGAGLRGFVGDQIQQVRGYEAVTVEKAVVVPADARRRSFPAAFATDGQPSRAWAVGWRGGGRRAPEGACGQVRSPAAGSLVVSLAQASRVDRVTIQPGLQRDNPNWSKQARPRTVELRFSDGTCQRISLGDAFEPQTFDVEARAVSDVQVVILDAYPQQEGRGDLTAISEIGFAARR